MGIGSMSWLVMRVEGIFLEGEWETGGGGGLWSKSGRISRDEEVYDIVVISGWFGMEKVRYRVKFVNYTGLVVGGAYSLRVDGLQGQ